MGLYYKENKRVIYVGFRIMVSFYRDMERSSWEEKKEIFGKNRMLG